METGAAKDMVCNKGRGVVVKYTEHYKFKKPEYEDFADVEDINYALDQLDSKFSIWGTKYYIISFSTIC